MLEDIGINLRELRKQRGLTLSDVSKQTGMTISSLSQIERGIANPSVFSLKKISDALEVPIGFFFEDHSGGGDADAELLNQKDSPVVSPQKRKIVRVTPGITFYFLNPDLHGSVEFIYNVYEPGADTGPDLYSHVGEECGVVVEGELEVYIGEQIYYLKEGDSITFKSSTPHRIRNTGTRRACGFWVNCPPWFK